MPRTRPPYPPEFRREAVQLVLAGRTVKDVAGSLGCSEQSLHNWVKQHQLDSRERQDGLTSAERDELRELRKRVKRVEQERDILKRAAVLFAAGDRDPVSTYRIISAERASFPVSVMCEVLGVSRCGFHEWERRPPFSTATLPMRGLPRGSLRSTSGPAASMARAGFRRSCGSVRTSVISRSACAAPHAPGRYLRAVKGQERPDHDPGARRPCRR